MNKFKTVGELKEYLSSLPDETKLCSSMGDDEYVGLVYTDFLDLVHSLSNNVTDFYCNFSNTKKQTEKVLWLGY